MAQRVTRKEIEITVGVCRFSVNIHLNFCAASTCNGVQGVSEKIGRILKQQKVKEAYKPQPTPKS